MAIEGEGLEKLGDDRRRAGYGGAGTMDGTGTGI